MKSVRGFVLLAGVLAAVQLSAHTAASPSVYEEAAKLPAVIDGKSLAWFSFDDTGRRLWAGSFSGLYWVNVDEAKPVWKTALKAKLTQAEFAKGLGRVFFATPDEVGYIDVDAPGQPHIIAKMRAHELEYEETRKELYVSSRDPEVRVFDGATGERSATIKLQGWEATHMRAVPGRVFTTLAGKQGVFVIDGATHALRPFPIDGKITTPAYIETDRHRGRYLFLSYDRTLVAIDANNGHVLGRRNFPFTPGIAFDEGTDLLVATFDNDPPPVRLVALRIGANGFEKVDSMENPAIGESGVIATRNGFLQRGHLDFVLWKTSAE